MTTPADPVLLALDVGSQSSRALLFDSRGVVLGLGQRAHAAMRRPEVDAVEQDPWDVRGALWAATQEVMARWGGAPQRVVGAALTTQRNAIMALDAAGKPLCDLVSWLDRRQAKPDGEGSWALRLLMAGLGEESLITRLLCKSVPRILLQRDPSLRSRIGSIAPLEAWLVQELTGTLAAAPGGYLGVWPLDGSKRRWGPAALSRLLGFDPAWLPKIVEAQGRLGTITGPTAAELGLPDGLPLYACGGDKQSEVLGAGVRVDDRGVAAVSLGTAASVTLPWKQPTASLRFEWLTNAGPEPGQWTLESMVFRGMWTARWFAEQFARDLEPAASLRNLPVEALLAEEAACVPVGSEGLMVWPRWSPSLQDPDESGVILGLRDFHTRAHMFRSLIEGIAFDLRRGLERLEQVTGQRVTELRVGGGGARSDLVVDILRDVCGRPVRRPPGFELAARGAAIVAAVGAGVHTNTAEAVRLMVPPVPLIAPDPGSVRRYDRIYREVWQPGLINHQAGWRSLGRLGRG